MCRRACNKPLNPHLFFCAALPSNSPTHRSIWRSERQGDDSTCLVRSEFEGPATETRERQEQYNLDSPAQRSMKTYTESRKKRARFYSSFWFWFTRPAQGRRACLRMLGDKRKLAQSSPQSAMVTGSAGLSMAPVLVPSMVCTMSKPSTTWPNTVCLPSSQGVGTVQMKN